MEFSFPAEGITDLVLALLLLCPFFPTGQFNDMVQNEETQTMRLMTRKAARFLVLLATALQFGCNHYTDLSNDPRYSQTVKRSFKTKQPLEVSTLNFPYTSYKDRHELGDDLHGSTTILGTLERSHTVYFERAVSDEGFDKPGLHYLEGYTTWKGNVIPIYYSLDIPRGQHKDLGGFYNDFSIE